MGVFILVHYNPSVLEAFNSIEHIMRDVNNGWLVRYLHSNTASAFFFLVYLHMGRGLYYGSYRSPRTLTWTIGTIIFLIMIVTGFLGLSKSPKWFNNFLFNNINTGLGLQKFYEIKIYKELSEASASASRLRTVYPSRLRTVYPSASASAFASAFAYPSASRLPTPSLFILEVKRRQFSTCSRFINISKNSSLCEGNKEANNEKKSKGNREASKNKESVNYSKEVTLFLEDKKLNSSFIYEDLGNSAVKSKIYREVKNLAGVYLILNKFTGDYYIGSASTNRFYSRFSKHLVNKSGSKIVKAAVNKYKIHNFAFILLEILLPYGVIVTKENNKYLLDLEDFYLKSLLPNYNILTEAGNSFGYKHTEITRINMVKNYSEERRAIIGNLNRGKVFTDEERKINSLAALSLNKGVYSEEALANMKKKSKSITVYNFNGTVYGQFSSIKEGANALHCSISTIDRALRTPKQILRRRWIVKHSYLS